jgi:hypothetical protein
MHGSSVLRFKGVCYICLKRLLTSKKQGGIITKEWTVELQQDDGHS